MENNEKNEQDLIKEQRKKIFSSFKSKILDEVFAIEDCVGTGTFGMVFKSRLRSNPKEIYALKKILIDNDKTIGFPLTAIREIMILKKLNHENLSNLIDVFTSRPQITNNNRGNVFLSFKYMDHDLYGMIHSRKVTLTLPQIKNIMFQILSGVQYLHKNSVIHRDLKTANILISNQGEVKITDFGLAKFCNPKLKKPYTTNVVTLWYRAPEILLGSTNYNFSVDLWSIGCIFCEILNNESPFQANAEKELFFQINSQLGAIRENNFPNLSCLPLYEKFKVSRDFQSKGKLKKSLKIKFDYETVDLAMKLLEIDPKKRITADIALKHSFFYSDPQICSNDSMPILDKDFHELNIRNGDHLTNESKKIENISLNNSVKEMKTGRKYINFIKEHEKEDTYLNNKRKN